MFVWVLYYKELIFKPVYMFAKLNGLCGFTNISSLCSEWDAQHIQHVLAVSEQQGCRKLHFGFVWISVNTILIKSDLQVAPPCGIAQ